MEIVSLRKNVDLLKLDGREIYLIGTAHISQASADLVEEIITQIKPDSVAVELCAPRFQSLKDPERWKNTDIVSVIREGKIWVLMAQLALAAFQKKLGAKLHIKPGAEMLRALELAEKTGSNQVLADREIKTTLKRTWAAVGFGSALRLLSSMTMNLLGDKEIDLEEIERLKASDALEELVGEFSEKLPGVKTALIDERDQYLSQKIKRAPGNKVVAVVGAGHVPGIKRFIETEIDLAPLEVIPEAGKLGRKIGWALFALVTAIITAGFMRAGAGMSFEMIKAWFWITGLAAAVGAALALPHPLTVIAAFLSSPVTTLHPILASGWVSGLVEALIRKPRVADFDTIADDFTSVRGVFRNRISKILVVIILTNLGGTIGSIVGTYTIASML